MTKTATRYNSAHEFTRDRILQVAGDLFAVQGFKATTLREITDAAQANLAAVNYHFRSKDELVESALEAAIQPIVTARFAALEACLAEVQKPQVHDLAEALVRPLHDLSSGTNRNRMLLLMQLSPDPATSHNALVSRHFAPLHQKFVNALEPALPHLSRAEIALRYDSARGATLQTLVELAPARELVALTSNHKKTLNQREQVVQGLIAFVSAGFLAPAVFKMA
jgi:AcrR family transcriptional regulator